MGFSALKKSLLVLTVTACPAAAMAEETTWFGQTADGSWMIGGSIATMQNAATGFSDANMIALRLGYQFSRAVAETGSSSIEFDFATSYDEGDIGINSDFALPGTWDADQLAIFFTYRTPGTVFFKGKIGAVQTEVKTNVANTTTSFRDTSFGYGAGLGYRAGDRGLIELEYVGVSGDNDVGTIGVTGAVLF